MLHCQTVDVGTHCFNKRSRRQLSDLSGDRAFAAALLAAAYLQVGYIKWGGVVLRSPQQEPCIQ
jgi:hypothetical protein